jgi:tetratricopeptide (TPR) repeat protein
MTEGAWSEAIVARARAGDVDGAIAALEARLAGAPDDAEAWLILGMVQGDAGRDPLAALARAVALDGRIVLGRVLHARALDRAGRSDEAERELLAAHALAPSHAGILRELGALAYGRGRYDDALGRFTHAAALAPAAPEAARIAYALGLVHEARRDLGAAIGAYREALRHDPRHADAWRTLADALANVGEHAQAIAALDALLRIDRTDERAAHNRDVLLGALEHMRAHRLLGKTARELASSATVEGGVMRTLTAPPGEARFGNAAALLHATLDEAGHATALFFAITDAAAAARADAEPLGVTVVGADGAALPAPYTTAASITFLRESLGIPMTQAAALFARLLAEPGPIDVGGARAAFASDGDRHGLRITATPA